MMELSFPLGEGMPIHSVFCAQGLSLPPWKRTRRKYHPNCTCRRHQPRTPNQSTEWA
jgi:hypothetical protein